MHTDSKNSQEFLGKIYQLKKKTLPYQLKRKCFYINEIKCEIVECFKTDIFLCY